MQFLSLSVLAEGEEGRLLIETSLALEFKVDKCRLLSFEIPNFSLA